MSAGRLCGILLLAPLLGGCMSFHRGAMPGEPKDATFAKVDGVRMRYVDRGPPTAPVVVFVHGFASSLDTWTTVMPAVEKAGFRVVAVDLKGFGWTDRPEGDYSPAAEAKLVYGLLDQRGVTKASFVGHSWGSSVVLTAAMMRPERVSRIAMYDAWVYEDQLPTFFHWSRADGVGEAMFALWYTERPDEKMANAFFDKRYVTEKLVEEVEAALERPGTVAAALAAVRGQHYADVEAKYRTIDKPTLLLWGREDEVTTLRFGERLASEMKQAKLVVYPQCGHFPMIEAQAASTTELVSFLGPELTVASSQNGTAGAPNGNGSGSAEIKRELPGDP
jgi:pimeloyl-ACP methyl ester carboxylesterase